MSDALRRALPCALALTFLLSPSASQAAGAPPSEAPPIQCSETPTGQWPEPEGLYRSGACLIQGVGGLSISPKVVAVGEPITASVPGTNPRPESKWGWSGFVAEVGGGHVLSGCGEMSGSCTVEASAGAVSNTWEVFSHAVSYPGIFAGTSYSSEYFIVEGGGGTITGSITSPTHKGLAGVAVTITGTSSGGQAVSDSATTAADGVFSQSVPEGSYTVAPSGTPPGQPSGGEYKVLACPGSEGPGRCSLSLTTGQREASFEYSPPHNQVSIALEPFSVANDGFGAVSATITVTAPNGEPVAGKAIRIEPPVTYDEPAIVCDENGGFAYPSRLPDGSILGEHFVRTTNAAGQIHLTIFMGTVAGTWLLEAGEEEAPLSQWAHADVPVSEAGGGRTELPPELTAILHSESQSNETLANFRRSGLANVLEFLGDEKTSAGALSGIGFMPVFSRDPAGIVNAGVVLFADATGVRQALFDYLDGKTSAPPPESQAVVIDIAGMQALHFSTYLAEHPTTVIGDHLYSLAQWENGSLVAIGENLRGEHPHVPIPARGRPHSGFAPPVGNEGFLYEYGPYPPFGAEGAIRSSFASCIGGGAGGLNAAGGSGAGGVSITAHSPVSLLATGSHGQKAGIGPSGKPVDTIPGAIVHHHGRKVSELQLPAGAYRLALTGTGHGHATLVIDTSRPHGVASEVFSFRVRKGERGRLAVGRGKVPTKMRLGHRKLRGVHGVGLLVRGAPRRIAHGLKSTLTLAVTDQFHKPVAGIRLSVNGIAGAKGLSTISGPGGKLALTVDPQAPGTLSLKLSGPGYRAKAISLKVT